MAIEAADPTVFRLIEIPEAKPAFEFLDGRLFQKVSPLGPHGLVQARLTSLLTHWCDSAGRPGKVAVELDIDVVIGSEASRVVPDVAYYVKERFPSDALTARHAIRVAPTAAFEIASPDDRWRRRVVRKLELYRKAGWPAIVIVDPATRLLSVREEGKEERTYRDSEYVLIRGLPGFAPRAADFFVDLDP